MISSSIEIKVGTLNTMSVKLTMPTILPSSMTGSLLILFFAISLAASSMLAVSLIVITGLVMICLAVNASGARHGSTSLLKMSRSVMIPTGLSPCITKMEPMSNLLSVATTSFMLVSGRTTLTSFDIMSLTRTIPAMILVSMSFLTILSSVIYLFLCNLNLYKGDEFVKGSIP